MVPSLAKFAVTMVLVSFPRLGPATPFKFRPPILRSFDPVNFCPLAFVCARLRLISWWDFYSLAYCLSGLA